MSECCGQKSFDGTSRAYRRALVAVTAINAIMFVTELSAGYVANSQALKADALDFGGDAATYTISLAVIGMSVSVRSIASLLKAGLLAIIAIFILISTLVRVFADQAPEAVTMSVIGVLALAANLSSVLILLQWRSGDSNVRSVWLCSRNDAIGNVAVIVAGGLVALTGSFWPDLLVAFALAGLFLKSSLAISSQALSELAGARRRNVSEAKVSS